MSKLRSDASTHQETVVAESRHPKTNRTEKEFHFETFWQ